MALRKKPPIGAPYREPDMTQEVAWAFKALGAGKASEAEQGLVLRFIVATVCEFYDNPYRDNDRDTNFALGKKFVGEIIFKAVNMPTEQIAKLPRFASGSSDGDDGAMKDM